MARADKHRKRLFGVQGRLMVAFCAVLFATLGTASLFIAKGVHTRFEASLQNRAKVASSVIASSVQPAIMQSDVAALAAIAQRATEKDDAIKMVVFRDADGAILAARRGTSTDAGSLPALKQEVVGEITHRIDPLLGHLDESTIPVQLLPVDGESGDAQTIGYVTIGVTISTAQQRTTEIVQLMVGVMCAVALLALPVSMLLVRSIFKPVRDLIKATKRIMTGDLSVRLLVESRDAFGDLASTFNELVQWVKQHRADLAEVNAKLASNNEELARRVEARTLQLEAANQRLAGEIAEKEDFLRAVSHDLNAPLRNIGGMVTMLTMKHKDLPEDVLHRLDRIKKNVDVETDLINELLELSRIKTRRGEVELLETEKMVWDLRGLFENDLKTRHIELIVDSSLPNLYVERARLRQVFQNLIDNAIKYMGERPTREIHIGCTVSDAEAQFYVRDTGTGIHPEDLDKVFFIFRRGRTEQTQKTAGKGIGLASVKSIIENYSGKIWVTSALNEGTTFHFTINGRFVPNVSGQTLEQLADGASESVAAKAA
ncbi:MAG: HAMP domain-containing sensor histidine kinase [Tepidisphaeraceae bacterium]